MIHQPPKFVPNPLTHFFNFHSVGPPPPTTMATTMATTGGNNGGGNLLPSANTTVTAAAVAAAAAAAHQLDMLQENSSSSTPTPLDVVNASAVGKSFTIAAILGLKKNAAAEHGVDYGDVMNLSNKNGSSLQAFDTQPAATIAGRIPAMALNGHNFSAHQQQHHHHQHQHQHHQHNTALQSLQQLHHHHHHHHHNNTAGSHGFQAAAAVAAAAAARDRIRNGDTASSKKASLKSKRVRTIFTPEQLERLEAEFERQQYMVGPERLYLAHTLQLTEAQVKVWFQNRRIKWRKHHLELTQQRLAIIRQRQITTTTNAAAVAVAVAGNGLPPMQSTTPGQSDEADLEICTDSMDESAHDGDES